MHRTARALAFLSSCLVLAACEAAPSPSRPPDVGEQSARAPHSQGTPAARLAPAKPPPAANNLPASAARAASSGAELAGALGTKELAMGIGTASGAGGLSLRGVGMGGGGVGLGTGRASGAAGFGSGEGALGSLKVDGNGVRTFGMGGRAAPPGSVGGSVGGFVQGGDTPPAPASGGTFVHAGTNPIVSVAEDPLSTFAADVDTGSYFYARRFLEMGRQPAVASVRLEEWVNALGYAYAPPTAGEQFAIHVDAAPSPFSKGLHVVRVALKGKEVRTADRKPAHVVFLVDVSGSMQSQDKLAWAKESMNLALDAMRADDSVAIVTYAGATGVVLPTTSARNKGTIRAAIEALQSGGGTNMGSGMELAYREATKELSSSRSARVVVLSDGDANIGRTSFDDIIKSIKGYVSEGVTMSTVGYGTGNYNDHLMEQLADAGNGTYTYVGSKQLMKRLFQDELTSTLEVIAQDVKIQVEWNRNSVESYRLLGYENRNVKDEDFRNDKKDAGEIGAGHAVTALYEVRLVPGNEDAELATVRVRAKAPRGTRATEVVQALTRSHIDTSTDGLDADAQAALGAALAAEVLRGSAYAEGLTLADAARLLRAAARGPFAQERRELADVLDKVPTASVAAR